MMYALSCIPVNLLLVKRKHYKRHKLHCILHLKLKQHRSNWSRLEHRRGSKSVNMHIQEIIQSFLSVLEWKSKLAALEFLDNGNDFGQCPMWLMKVKFVQKLWDRD